MSHRARVRKAWKRWGIRNGKEGIERCGWKQTPRYLYRRLADVYPGLRESYKRLKATAERINLITPSA
jgi:hypothetical protein